MREIEGERRRERLGRAIGREEFSSRRKPFPWRGDPRRERKTAGEREKERDKERERRKNVEEREAFPPASPRDGISVARERARGRERNGRERERGKRGKREEIERMKGRKKGGEEFNFPPPFARYRRAQEREGGWTESGRGGKVGKKDEREGRE